MRAPSLGLLWRRMLAVAMAAIAIEAGSATAGVGMSFEVSARHPTVEYATFAVTCVQDRAIDASPPWGLHGIP